MPVPATVLELLNKSASVSYSVKEEAAKLSVVPKTQNSCRVRSVILQDSQGKVQVILPANAIIDLDSMLRHFGRNFEPVPSHDVIHLVQSKSLSSLPAIPRWQGMATYVDDALFKYEALELDSGDSKDLVEMTQDNFRALVEDCSTGAFSQPAPEIRSGREGDEAQILDAVQKFTEKRIRQRLDETLELPPLPETAQRIIKLRADPNADISDLTNIVEIDPSLAAQVVSWAASPYYSAPGKIKSVHDAIVRVLGFDMVLNLALGLALGKTLSMAALSKEQINGYWRNAVYSAATVEGLVTSIGREHRPAFGMAYLSGLLNNFGWLIMAEVFPPYFKVMNRASGANPHLPSAIVETQVMGVSGDLVASWLLENWSMPDEVVTALRQQANPCFDGEHASYARLNYVARQMLANHGIGHNTPQEIPQSVFDDLHLDPEQAQHTLDNILEASDDLDAIAEKMRG